MVLCGVFTVCCEENKTNVLTNSLSFFLFFFSFFFSLLSENGDGKGHGGTEQQTVDLGKKKKESPIFKVCFIFF
jgi:hypothetical protein